MVVIDIRIAGVVEFQPSVVVYDLSPRRSGGISLLGFQESEHAARQIGFAEASRRLKKLGKAHHRRGGVSGDYTAAGSREQQEEEAGGHQAQGQMGQGGAHVNRA